jgi:PAS domain S-box-containing protein
VKLQGEDMSFYVLSPLFALFIHLFLAFLVLKADHRSFLHRVFALTLLGMGLWGLAIFGMRSSPDLETALARDKAIVAIGPVTAVLFYHFSLIFTGVSSRKWLIVGYSLSAVFVFLAPTDLVFSNMRQGIHGYAPTWGYLGAPFMIMVYGAMALAISNLVKFWRSSTSKDQRHRAALIIAGIICVPLGGATDALHMIEIPVPPLGIIGNILFGSMATVAILRYHLLDIQVAIRKSLAYLLVSLVIAVPYVSILLFLNQILRTSIEPWWVHTIIVLLLAILLRPLYSRAQNLVDRLFYRDRYDYLKALETFSQQTQSITDSARLGSTMVNLLTKALRSSNVYLLQPLPPSSDFTTVYPNGENNPTHAIHLKNGGALVKWLERSNSMLSYKDIDIIPQLQGITSKEKQILQQVGAELISPLKAPTGQLSGILIMGKKLSEQPYNSEDKQLLYTICNHMSTNLENARLYNESQHEINERKRAEESLRLQQAYFQQLFDNSPDAIVMLDNTDRVVQINDGFERLFGYQAEEIKDRFINELIIPEDHAEEAATLSRTALDGKAARKETVRKCKDGSLIEVSALGYPIHFDNKTMGVYVIYSDITKRKQAEEREKELQRELYLSSRLASIGELASGVAHQLNNPLTGILGFSQRLLRKITDQETNQDLEKIYVEAERAAKIVQNLLTFARRRQPKKEYSDVNDIVQSALELRAYELKTSNIEVVTNLASKLSKIMLDFHQIQEVFLNLILNAEQAMTGANGGGKLTIKTEENNRYVRATFTDDGPGIPAEHTDKIFDPFFTTKGEKGGTGLGLSVCHGIISKHGGKIYAKCKPGKGAKFFVDLPIIAKE